MPHGAETKPQILLPYPGPDLTDSVQDIFVYLRPETNGVQVESALVSVIRGYHDAATDNRLIYLANVPGQFIVERHIVEHHYADKLVFAVHGKRAFTESMRVQFEQRFDVKWSAARIIGSFEALQVFDKSPEELFTTWVPDNDITFIEGQTIKRIGDVYVVNYDIPALLHKNNRNTDIAVMLFRCTNGYDYFEDLVLAMHRALVDKGLLSAGVHLSRAFHYSKGPFEQILDARDYLYDGEGSSIDLRQLTFVQYAVRRGYECRDLLGAVENPISLFEQDDGSVVEKNLYTHTLNDTYEEALEKMSRIRAQLWAHRF